MSKSHRDIHHCAILSCQLISKELQKGRGLRAYVHNYIEERSSQAAHDLCFTGRRKLIMQTPQCSALRIQRVVDLNKLGSQAMLLKFLFAIKTCKEPALIFTLLKVDQVCPFEGCFSKSHEISPYRHWIGALSGRRDASMFAAAHTFPPHSQAKKNLCSTSFRCSSSIPLSRLCERVKAGIVMPG